MLFLNITFYLFREVIMALTPTEAGSDLNWSMSNVSTNTDLPPPAWATWDLLSLSLMGRELCSVSGSTGTGVRVAGQSSLPGPLSLYTFPQVCSQDRQEGWVCPPSLCAPARVMCVSRAAPACWEFCSSLPELHFLMCACLS